MNFSSSTWEVWNEYERDSFKVWLKGMLEQEVVTITFTKQDGTERVMKSTLQADMIPSQETKTDVTRRRSNDVISVIDIEKKEWRSIRYDSMKRIEAQIGGE